MPKKDIGGQEVKEWIRDMSVEARLEYKKAEKSAKQAAAVARKEASDKLMKKMEVDVSLRKMFKIAKQSMNDRET